jgi:Cof subfamily protein (haloacid dehalogenase superfamily)
MSNFKMIALDLDDTVLMSDLSISKRTRNVVKKALQAGIIVVIATGRVPGALKDYVKVLGINKQEGYLICGNGTIIMDSRTEKIIDESRLPPKAALAAFDLIDAEGFAVQIYDEDSIIVSRRNEFFDTDHKLTGMNQIIPDDFRSVLVRDGTRKMVVSADPMLLKPLEEILVNVVGSRLTLFTSKPYYLEILPPGCDKGAALATIAGKLGIKKEDVMAFGDSMNDEAMIRWAGCGVAMCNGDDRVKDVARLVTEKTNDEDGVAEIIERYVINGETIPC